MENFITDIHDFYFVVFGGERRGGGGVYWVNPQPPFEQAKKSYVTQGLLITKRIFFNDRK